ncbi:Glycine oxidase [Novipirellula aureliae]|uniref:Glycine oxidase n=2 Tax=Novipirellula aureliae TaxID=2527966 RepID=A0A5C6DII6_9BACT|nr:Glycine oxidase [Novipirellula aureliae]
MSPDSPLVTVVGGGAIGMSIAWELRRRGKQVRLIERNRIGDSTSRVAAGILPPANLETATDAIDRLRGYSHMLFPKWANELSETTGMDIGLRRCGGFYLGNTAGEKAVMAGMVHFWNDMQIECDHISIDQLVAAEPAIARWLSKLSNVSAWWVPDEYQVCTPAYLQALHQACQQTGVEIIEQTNVTDLRFSADSTAVCTESGWIESASVVLCGGSWTGLVCESLGLSEALIPIRGQILVFKTDQPLLRSIVNIGNRYLLSRDDGHLLVGSCEEETGFDCRTTKPMIESLKQFAISIIPELEAATIVEDCAGLRPLTFDGFPMIGRHPKASNLFVAAGHYRSGIHLSPATAVCMADIVLGKKPPLNLDAFRVGSS